jgi:hypothetical protein
MSMKKLGNAVAVVGTYTNRQGEEKKQYQNCGVFFENDRGEISIKLSAIPAGNYWTGFLNCYPDKEKDESRSGKPGLHHAKPKVREPGEDDEDIPF